MIDLYIQKCEHNLSESAHALLYRLLKESYQISDPCECCAECGKPYLATGPYIGISHSRGWIIVGISDVMFGIDLEIPRKVQIGLATRVMSESELSWYRKQGNPTDAFLTLWTLKESYYKYLGLGLPGFPNHTEFFYDGDWKLRGCSCSFSVLRVQELRIAVCSYTEQSINCYFL